MSEEEVALLVEEKMRGAKHGDVELASDGKLVGVWQKGRLGGSLQLVRQGRVEVNARAAGMLYPEASLSGVTVVIDVLYQ